MLKMITYSMNRDDLCLISFEGAVNEFSGGIFLNVCSKKIKIAEIFWISPQFENPKFKIFHKKTPNLIFQNSYFLKFQKVSVKLFKSINFFKFNSFNSRTMRTSKYSIKNYYDMLESTDSDYLDDPKDTFPGKNRKSFKNTNQCIA